MRRKRSVRVVPMLTLACCVLALPETAPALPLCDLTGDVSFTPVHPQATDVIGFNVTLSAVYFGPPQFILSKATIGPGLQATLDIVITTDARALAITNSLPRRSRVRSRADVAPWAWLR